MTAKVSTESTDSILTENFRKLKPFTPPPELELKEKKEFICKRIVSQVFEDYLSSVPIPMGIFSTIIIIDRETHKMKIVRIDELKSYQNKYDLSNCFIFKCSYNSKENCQYADFWTNKKE